MTKRMVTVLGTALITAGILLAWPRQAAADNDTNKPNSASDRNSAGNRAGGAISTGGTTTGNAPSTNDRAGNMNAGDKAFLIEAARNSQAEIDLGQLAADHGTNGEVTKFGQQMAVDHTRMNNELRPLAIKNDIQMPGELDAQAKAFRDQLLQTSQRSGVEFDRDYMRRVIQDHEQNVSMFQREIGNGTNADMQSWAQRNLQMEQDHLRQARNISDRLKKNRTAKR